MVFGAQDPSGVIYLNQVVVLINTTTTAGVDHRRIFINDLWRLVGDPGRLVGRRDELRRRIIERALKRRIELGYHLFSHLPQKRQVTFGVLAPHIVQESPDTLIVLFIADLLKLSRGVVLRQCHSPSRGHLLHGLNSFPLYSLDPSL